MYTEDRAQEVTLLKRLWRGEQTSCPKCGSAVLKPLHRRVRRREGNLDWQCPVCGEIYRTIRMLKELPPR